MKVDIPIFWIIVLAVLIFFMGWYGNDFFTEIPTKTVTVNRKGEFDIVTLKLPNNPNPQVFGSKYWEAFHKLAQMVPCPACRSKAVPFMSFFHDVVNNQTGKELYDKKNYDYWINFLWDNNINTAGKSKKS